MSRPLDPQSLGDHLDRLFRAAWALTGTREDAEDLVQETYERVLRRPRFVRRENDLAYLYRALRHTYFNVRRTASCRAVNRWNAEFATASPNRLKPTMLLPMRYPDYALTELRYAVDVLGLTYAEAGKALGIHENTVPSRLARGRLKVTEALRA